MIPQVTSHARCKFRLEVPWSGRWPTDAIDQAIVEGIEMGMVTLKQKDGSKVFFASYRNFYRPDERVQVAIVVNPEHVVVTVLRYDHFVANCQMRWKRYPGLRRGGSSTLIPDHAA